VRGNRPQLYLPDVLRHAIDDGIGAKDAAILKRSAVIILSIYALRGLFGYVNSYLEYLSQHVAYDLRNALYTHIQSLSFSFHDKAQTGQLMSRVTADVETSRMFLSSDLAAVADNRPVRDRLRDHAQVELAVGPDGPDLSPIVLAISISTSRKLRPISLGIAADGRIHAVLQEALAASAWSRRSPRKTGVRALPGRELGGPGA
jgi:ATP-binding cassette subfamily B protein